jgi:hypothetical protein
MTKDVAALLEDYSCVGLYDLDNVKLMNRIDTKFIFPIARLADLLEIMKGQYRVLEINGERILGYNTTYFDTADYLFFNQHVTGRPERNKVRVRYYLSTATTYLEVKRRTRKNRTIKWRIEQESPGLTLDGRALEFLSGYVPDVAAILIPALHNDFRRITFAGCSFQERVTIDIDLKFRGTDGEQSDIPFLTIAELKSDGPASRSNFGKLIRQLSVKSSGFSKYCLGDALLYDIPKKNVLKSKLILLNKLENDFKSSLNA